METSAPILGIQRELMAQHDELRQLVDGCEGQAKALEEGGEPAEILAERVGVLLAAIDAHNRAETLALVPILRAADAFGAARIGHMIEDHHKEHAVLRDALHAAVAHHEDAARRVLKALERVRQRLDEEEQSFLNDHVLRDDLVVDDASGG